MICHSKARSNVVRFFFYPVPQGPSNLSSRQESFLQEHWFQRLQYHQQHTDGAVTFQWSTKPSIPPLEIATLGQPDLWRNRDMWHFLQILGLVEYLALRVACLSSHVAILVALFAFTLSITYNYPIEQPDWESDFWVVFLLCDDLLHCSCKSAVAPTPSKPHSLHLEVACKFPLPVLKLPKNPHRPFRN